MEQSKRMKWESCKNLGITLVCLFTLSSVSVSLAHAEIGDLAPALPKSHLRIASWNLVNFSNRRTPKSMSLVARVIRENGFDLMAMQEINEQKTHFSQDENGRWRAKAMDRLIEELEKQTGETWQYIVTDKLSRGWPRSGGSFTGGKGESYGFIWKTSKVDLIGTDGIIVTDPQLNPDQNEIESPLTRPPFAATFKSGKFDFTLVSFHATFGRKTYPNGKAASNSVKDMDRKREILQLDDVFAEVQRANGAENDVIMVGDFNMNPTEELLPEKTWSEEFGDLVALFMDPTLYQTTCKGQKKNLYDNIWFDPQYTGFEYTGREGVFYFDQVYADEMGWPKTRVPATPPWEPLLSDHRPVWADFKTSRDDDARADYGVFTVADPSKRIIQYEFDSREVAGETHARGVLDRNR